jgi:hypothetical protein
MNTPDHNQHNEPLAPQQSPRNAGNGPDSQARTIAEAVTAAWHQVDHSGRLDIPLATLATLAVVAPPPPTGRLAAQIAAHGASEFHQLTRAVWTRLINQRPEITHLLFPLINWIFDNPDAHRQQQAHAVAQAATKAGVLDLAGGAQRFQTDLLGVTLTALRPPSGRQARGQFYTPSHLATLTARLLDVHEHTSVADPTMGTGGMFRAVAETMRDHGRNPETIHWAGADIDPLAVACATVNSIIWRLGPNILFYAGNSLDPDWINIAQQQRHELARLANDITRTKYLLTLLTDLPRSSRPDEL